MPWLATAYVPGISVEDAVRRYGPMPADSVRVLGFCVARAVAAIHAVGLVHRDLKPGNVLLTAQGPKVIDFGIARGVGDEGLTKTGMVAGSPPYMAPEQLTSGDFGTASDVFSLGAILHYAATAAGPYGRGGAQELYARALALGPVVAPDLPEAVAGPVARALARDPEQRPTATGLAAALEREPGERPVPGWLPGNVVQDILTQATEALNTASAAYTGTLATQQQTPGPQQQPVPGPQPMPQPFPGPRPLSQPILGSQGPQIQGPQAPIRGPQAQQAPGQQAQLIPGPQAPIRGPQAQQSPGPQAQPQRAPSPSQGPAPAFAPPYPQSAPPSHPSTPRTPSGRRNRSSSPPSRPPRPGPRPPPRPAVPRISILSLSSRAPAPRPAARRTGTRSAGCRRPTGWARPGSPSA